MVKEFKMLAQNENKSEELFCQECGEKVSYLETLCRNCGKSLDGVDKKLSKVLERGRFLTRIILSSTILIMIITVTLEVLISNNNNS
jgi:predicted amidophosphoribosyltransferase